MCILAQLPIKDEKAIEKIGEKLADAVGKGFEQGLKTTSENAPTNWILMFAAVMLALLGFVAIIFIVIKFIGALKDLSNAQDSVLKEIGQAQDKRDEDHRAHVRAIQTASDVQAKEARNDCHDHSKEIVAMGKESITALAALGGKLESTAAHMDQSSHAVEKSVHNIRNVLQEYSSTLALALARGEHPAIFQNINPNPSSKLDAPTVEEGT